MDNRTIRRAITRRVPEIYFISSPIQEPNRIKWALLAKINGKPYKLVADMPNTALVSHNVLLTTMASEIYDEVAKIKRGAKTPDILPNEAHLPPLTFDELAILATPDRTALIDDSKKKLII